jgi:uncharacterized protein with PIN domain
MLGGLARWLRAAGYDASWREGIPDWDLVREARRDGRILLTSDTGILRIGVVRDGDVRSLFVPHGLGKREQLAHVLTRLGLPPLPPRCMRCGGALLEVPPEAARPRVPARTFAWVNRFFECERCGHMFWRGTHWPRIDEALRQAGGSG